MSKELDEFYKRHSARIIAIDDTPLVKVMDGGKFKLLSIEEYEEMTNKLADLEAKLAQAQKTIEIQKMSNDALIDENLDYRYDITDTAYELAKGIAEDWELGYKDEIAELKQQLAEKTLTIEQINKAFIENRSLWKCKYERANQDKISFALEQLSQTKEFIKEKLEYMWKNNAEMTCRDRNIIDGIYTKLDEQIELLKEGK